MDSILEVLNTQFPGRDFLRSNDFFLEHLLDSFDVIILVKELEKSMGICISGADILPQNFKNASAILTVVNKSLDDKNT